MLPPLRRRPGDTTTVVAKVDTITNHAKAFNIFTLPFSDFNVWIDVGKFKELTGVTRKYAIPLLEYLDRQRVTRRVGDAREIL